MNEHLVTRREKIAVGNDEICADFTFPAGHFEQLVVLVHGGPGGVKEGPVDLFVELARQLAHRNIASVRFDFLGAGDSSGSYEHMTITRQTAELKAVVEHIRSQVNPGTMSLVGESYGATIAILGLQQASYSSLVLLWPAIWLLDKTFQSFVTPEKVRLAREQGYIEEEGEKIGPGFLEELLTTDNVSAGLNGISVPTLFVHGTSDQEVPYQQSVRAAELVAGKKRVVLVPEGDHCLEDPREREVVYREVVEWVEGAS